MPTTNFHRDTAVGGQAVTKFTKTIESPAVPTTGCRYATGEPTTGGDGTPGIPTTNLYRDIAVGG
jgi:hypothetical protein